LTKKFQETAFDPDFERGLRLPLSRYCGIRLTVTGFTEGAI